MKTKRIFFAVLAGLFALAACEETGPAVPTLTVQTTDVDFDAIAGSKTITVESNVSWTAAVDEAEQTPWLSAEKAEGGLAINVTANGDTDEREGSVTITAGAKTSVINVLQAGAAITMAADKDSVKTTAAGATQTVNLTSNVAWTAEFPSWVSLDKTSGDGNAAIAVTVEPYADFTDRTGEIAFYFGMSKKTVVGLKQDGYVVELSLDKEAIAATTDAGNATVTISSNVAWTATSPVTWITLTPAEGEAGASQAITVAWAEAVGEERAADVAIKAGNVTKTIAIHQDKAEAKPIVLDVVFTNGSKSNQPFTTNFVSSVASSYNLGPKTYTLKETTYQFEIYSAYIGHLINTVNGCLLLAWDDGVYTKDIREEPFAYIKFPAIPEYKLAKVTIATSATAPNPSTLTYPAYITPTYGSTNAEAIAAAIGSTSNLGRTGLANPNVLTTTNPAANTAYYLFLPPQTSKTTGYQTMIMELHLEYQPQ